MLIFIVSTSSKNENRCFLSNVCISCLFFVDIILEGFFGLTASLVVITNNNVQTLGGVYTIAFLSVMSLFAIGNLLLKYKRARLPRPIRYIFFQQSDSFFLFSLTPIIGEITNQHMVFVYIHILEHIGRW